MHSCTVVLASVGTSTDPTRQVLTDWVHHRLIRAPLWLEFDGDEGFTARWLGAPGQADGVLEAIAAEPFELIRMVRLILDGGDGPDTDVRFERFLAASHEVQADIAAALAPVQRFVRINLAVPADETSTVPATVFRPLTDPNVLVAPVSRISPAHLSTDITARTHPGHAASALATVGALWVSMGTGPYDPPLTGETSGVHVARNFGRLLQLEGALTDITGQALARRRSETHMARAAEGAVAPQPSETVSDTTRQFQRTYGERLSFRPPAPPQVPRQQAVSILAAFVAMLRFILGGLRALPERIVTGVVTTTQNRIERIAQELTFGADSIVAVTVGARRRRGSEDEQAVTDATEAAADNAQELLRQVTGESATPPAMGQVWAALRRTVFSLHDGSDPPEGVAAPMDGRTRLVVTDPAMLAPDPKPGQLRLSDVPEHFAPIVHAPIRVCDPFQAAQVAQVLEQGGRVPEPPSDADDDASGDTPTEISGPDQAAALRLRAELDAWVQERERSLLWRLCRETGEALGAAHQALIDTLGRIAQGVGPADQDAAEAARVRLRRSWLLVTVLSLLSSVGAYLLYPGLGILVTTTLAVIHVIVSLVIWFMLLLWRFARYQRELFRLRYQHDRRHAAYVHALKTSTEIAQSIVALASAYEQLRAWAEVTGWLLHHPEGPTTVALQRPDRTEPVASPPGVGVVVGTISEASKRRLGALAGDELFGVGWATGLYERYLGESMDRLRFEEGLADPPEPDWQLTRPWPLDTLLEDLASGDLAAAWAREIVQRVADELADIDPADVSVVADGETLPADDFLREILGLPDDDEHEVLCPPIWSDQARNRAAHALTQTATWAPSGLGTPSSASRGGPGERAGTVADLEVDVVTLASLRFDTTDAVQPAQLRVCAVPRQGDRPDAEAAFDASDSDAL